MAKSLEEYLREKSGGRITYKVLEEFYYRVAEGRVRLRDPSPPETFAAYLGRLDYNLWLYTSLLLAVATLVVIWASGIVEAIMPLRYVLGSIYVLFLPGYSLIEALYPEEGRLSDLEKLALSIGLSLAIVPLIGLVLNYTPWGIRLNPYIVASFTLIISLLFTGSYRRYKLLSERIRASQAL
ncbi:MAG: DUF1616 domain-containing protein [Desulfurococcales archaeon]|nr:DUF1616 domain-containing protein [Desulfurococcales archaeon]